MWWGFPDGPERGRNDDHDVNERNRRALLSVGAVFALALFIASTLPQPLVAPALQSLLFYAALGAAVLALVIGDDWQSEHLTLWDQTAALLLLSMLVGTFADPAAVRDVIAPDPGAAL